MVDTLDVSCASTSDESASLECEDRPDRVRTTPWRALAVFVLVSFGLAWLTILPLWLTETDGPTFTALAAVLPSVMMFSPLVATLAVVFLVRVPRGERPRFLGIWPLRPAKRVVWFMAAATVAPLLLVAASISVSSLLGWIQLDLIHLSGVQSLLDTPMDESELRQVLLLQIAVVPFAAVFNAFLAFGEEIGWRGWLVPALRPLGLWPALLLSGVVWGLWPAPMTLLGHNFDQPNLLGVTLMTVGSMTWGVLFGWLRLRSGSVWPAVLAHSALNSSGVLVLMLATAGVPLNMALVNPFGLSGWIVAGVTVSALALTGQFRHEPQLRPERLAATTD